MTNSEYRSLYVACRQLEDGPDYRMSDYALNLINTALDFQMNVIAVNKAMEFYSDNIGFKSHRALQGVVCSFPDTEKGNKQLSLFLWSNNMWTRAKFLRVLLNEFELRGIKGQKSLERWLRGADFKHDVAGQFRSTHHSIGFALFHWLCLRCGIDTVKPDSHILNFVSNSIGRRANTSESVEALMRISKEQNRKAHLLDAAIWHYQRNGA